jgi:RNA polymerase sigma factor (sigma-70 family)
MKEERAAIDVDLRKCVQGDKGAWDALVERFASLIHRTCSGTFRRYLGEAKTTDIEDATQEVFVLLLKDDYRLLKSYDASRASLATWVALVARSTAVDLLRRRRLPEAPLEDLAAQLPAREERNDRPMELPPAVVSSRQQLVLHLLFDRDLDVREVAELLGVDEQTVRSTKHKALSALRKHFGVARST